MTLFVSGTGTEVGKTLITAALAHQAGPGWRALKPVASGLAAGGESDAGLLARIQGCAASDLCLYALQAPLAPPQAARIEGLALDWARIVAFCQGARVIVEGAGGLFSPLTEERTNADLARALDAPVLLVAGSYLGAMTHTLATLYAARAQGIEIVGLVLSQSEGGAEPEEMLQCLRPLAALPPVVCVPRLTAAEPWRQVPDLTQFLGATRTAR